MQIPSHWGKPLSVLAAWLLIGRALTASGAPMPDALGALRAASEEPPAIAVSEATGAVDFFGGAVRVPGGSAAERARNFLQAHGAAFGVHDAQSELSVLREDSGDAAGMSHVTFEQVYRGVPIFGARLVVHLDRAGRVTAANGHLQPGIALASVMPAIDGAAAQAVALNDLGAASIAWQRAPRLVVWTHNRGGAAARVAWELVGFSEQPPGRWHYFVDARSGEVAYRLDELRAAKNRSVYTSNNGTSVTGIFVCDEAQPNLCATDLTAQWVFSHTGTVYDYYWTNFGRDSYDGVGAALDSTVHYGINYTNTFWTGTRMVYGDGDGDTFSPLARDLDVVAHEWTHALTDHTSGLFGEGQSGALDESYADVFAHFINPANWKFGEASYLADPIYGLRNLADPTKGGQWDANDPYGSAGQPDHMSNIAVVPSQLDNGGVHLNSGIPNKAAYLLVNGGMFHGITVASIGTGKTQQIYYRSHTLYNTPFTDFAQAARNTERACLDLVGLFEISGEDCRQVANAWAAVGVGTRRVYLPLVAGGSSGAPGPGIYGRVTDGGDPAAGISIELHQCPASGGTCSVAITANTDSGGNYLLAPGSALPNNQYYQVVYLQPGSCPSTRIGEWRGNWITGYRLAERRHGGDFDIRAVSLVAPLGNVTGTSKTFTWTARTLPAGMLQDYPSVVVWDSSISSVVYNSGPRLRGSTSHSSAFGFNVGSSYYWSVQTFEPFGTGIPLCKGSFSITGPLNSGFVVPSAPSSPPQRFTAKNGYPLRIDFFSAR